MILQALNEIQDRRRYLPAEELKDVAQRLRQPLHRVHELASFYPLFRLRPPPAVAVQVCRDMACHLRGAARIQENLKGAATDISDGLVVEGVSCLGQCDRPVAVAINGQIYRGLEEVELRGLVGDAAVGKPLPLQAADRSPLGWRIDPYDGEPRHEAVSRVVKEPSPEAVLREIETAKLCGMGGAGFPTARKWAAVRDAPADVKYVICNADESEPGTFKDRELLRRTPHLVLEGMILAGLVTGAAKGILYIRHEYHDEIEAMREALAQAQSARICGQDILGSGRSFPIEIFVSPGGYIQGEESALREVSRSVSASVPARAPVPHPPRGVSRNPRKTPNISLASPRTFCHTVKQIVIKRNQGLGHNEAHAASSCSLLANPRASRRRSRTRDPQQLAPVARPAGNRGGAEGRPANHVERQDQHQMEDANPRQGERDADHLGRPYLYPHRPRHGSEGGAERSAKDGSHRHQEDPAADHVSPVHRPLP